MYSQYFYHITFEEAVPTSGIYQLSITDEINHMVPFSVCLTEIERQKPDLWQSTELFKTQWKHWKCNSICAMRSVSLYKLLNAICASDNDSTARHLTELLSKGAREQQNHIMLWRENDF